MSRDSHRGSRSRDRRLQSEGRRARAARGDSGRGWGEPVLRPLPHRVPPPPARAAAAAAGRPPPAGVTSRTLRELWRSYARNVRAEPAGGTSRARAAAAAAAAPRAREKAPPRPPAPPPPAERGRRGNGITGAECCLFSAECQEIGPGGCQAHLPGVGGGRGRRGWTRASRAPGAGLLEKGALGQWGSLTPPRGGCSESTDSFPSSSGSSFLLAGAQTPSRPAEPTPPPPRKRTLYRGSLSLEPRSPASQSLIHQAAIHCTHPVCHRIECAARQGPGHPALLRLSGSDKLVNM